MSEILAGEEGGREKKGGGGDCHSRAHCGVCDKRIFYFGDGARYRIIWRVAVNRVIQGSHDGVGDSPDSPNRCL